MIDAPIGPGADIFITLFILAAAFIGGVVAIDIIKSLRSKEKEGEG